MPHPIGPRDLPSEEEFQIMMAKDILIGANEVRKDSELMKKIRDKIKADIDEMNASLAAVEADIPNETL